MPPHCDSLDGPVVQAAIRALEAENFELRYEGTRIRASADRYFFVCGAFASAVNAPDGFAR